MSEDDRTTLDPMGRKAHTSVTIQTEPSPVPALPPWFGEVTVIAQYLQHIGALLMIEEQVRFARRRFGHYDLIDFVVVLLGYAIMGNGEFIPICAQTGVSSPHEDVAARNSVSLCHAKG
jgi:hypothetical protein